MVVGGALFGLGALITLAGRVPFLGRLPGDILIKNDGTTIYIPLATMLIVSLGLTILLNIIGRFLR